MSDLYKEAATLLQKYVARKASLKTLVYSDSIHHTRSTFALVCETLRHKPLIEALIAAVPKLQKWVSQCSRKKSARRASASDHTFIVYVQLYDLMFGKDNAIKGGGYIKREISQYARALGEALVRMKIKAQVKDHEDLLPIENRKKAASALRPRYVRVNALKAKDCEVKQFIDSTGAKEDQHIPDLLLLPPKTDLHDHEMVLSGKLVLQEKASCIPAYILCNDKNWKKGDIIDACAAPGNKTSHLAMLLKQKGSDAEKCKVFAFDLSDERAKLLKARLHLAGANAFVESSCNDFLKVDVHDSRYENVKSILLDPSCSGSGMMYQFDSSFTSARDQEASILPEQHKGECDNRIAALANFQLQMLLQAFSFDRVQRVLYSTCSIYQKENEKVVALALKRQKPGHLFALKKCMPGWHRRGLQVEGLTAEQASCLIRSDGDEDQTIGFFVAYFERESTSSNECESFDTSEKISQKFVKRQRV